MNSIAYFLSLSFFSLSFILTPAAFSAESKQQKQTELKALQQKILKLQDTIAVKQDSKNQYIKQLRHIEKNIGLVNKKIKKAEQSIKTSNKRLKKLNKEHGLLKLSLSRNKAKLEKQIYGAYVQGSNSQLQMIFNQQDPARFQRQLVFYQYVAQQQSELITAVNHDIEKIAATSAQIKKESTQLNKTKQQFVRHKKTLTKDQSKRKGIIANLDKQLKKQGNHLKSLNEDAAQLKQLIASINEIFKNAPQPKIPFKKSRGKLPWPLQGKLKTMYGHTKPLSNLKWQGHVIYAKEGNHVRAISSGRIAYSDWLKGFGNLVIIDHGDSYLSLYSHNQSLYKTAGEYVEKGEIISSAGSSGGLKKSGIYFEIRRKGKPQNPSIWCNRKNKFFS